MISIYVCLRYVALLEASGTVRVRAIKLSTFNVSTTLNSNSPAYYSDRFCMENSETLHARKHTKQTHVGEGC